MRLLSPLVLSVALGFAVPASAASVTPATLGFDPAKFGLPVYPGSSLRIGAATSGKNFAGKSARSAVLETGDPVDVVANWYSLNWTGASRQTSPGAAMAEFSKIWGTGALTVTIFRNGAETYIRIVVPGTY